MDTLCNKGAWATGSNDYIRLVNRGTEIDWMRFLWNLMVQESLTFAQVLDVFVNASPHDWIVDGDTLASGSPWNRLKSAADAAGLLTPWEALGDIHGVDH